MKQSRPNGRIIDAVIPRVTGAASASALRIYAVSALFLGIVVAQLTHGADSPPLEAGASAVDISPPNYPVRVNGMFNERSAESAVDPLYARAFALRRGDEHILFCIVDTCMMEQDLIDAAKQSASNATGIAPDRMMVSATHTHSAPSAMSCLGSRQDPDYAAWLPAKISEALVAATNNLEPAQVGWAAVDDWQHTHNRRWIRRADKTFDDPFGNLNVRAHMHPGYESGDIIGPSGPVDPGLSLLAARRPDGTPIALLANYSQHYYSSPLLSADYFGVFATDMARRLGQPSSEGPFVAMMSQGTSGDLMWMDYGAPKKEGDFSQYAQDVAERAMDAYHAIEWQNDVPLGMVEKTLTLQWRFPDAERLRWAQERLDALDGALPHARPDIYAQEALFLHERQQTELKLQAIRIGDLSIATLPNEVYAITGLKLKGQSPLDTHFNIELANGSVGYIPPPEQHALGGYTTWPARTAGLEVQAEPIIVETLLSSLEAIAGAPRKPLYHKPGVYTEAVLAQSPSSYWRLNEIEGRTAHNAVDGGPEGKLTGGVALYLPGVGSGSGNGAEETLCPSAFSSPDQINRAMHFVADGTLKTPHVNLAGDFSITLWFWLGDPSGVSIRDGELVLLPNGKRVAYTMDETGTSRLTLSGVFDNAVPTPGNTPLEPGAWHLMTLTQRGETLALFVNDGDSPEVSPLNVAPSGESEIRFGNGLEGKLDEIALFPHALTTEDRKELWVASDMARQQQQARARDRKAEEALAVLSDPPRFPDSYGEATNTLNPRVYAPLNTPTPGMLLEGSTQLSGVGYAAIQSGRIRASAPAPGASYSVAFWFKNTLANTIRPVTAYLFSRGPEGDSAAPGDHLGIGGSFRNQAGRLILFNGNGADEVIAGETLIPPNTWNHVVLVRDGNRVKAWLNGETTPEFDAEITPTAPESSTFFLGARSDRFAPLMGFMAQFSLFDRALTSAEAQSLHRASGQPVGMIASNTVDQVAQLDAPPLAPDEARQSIHVPDGFTVDLVASEPQVLDPVAFDWDVEGRLWVVEMADYPLGLDDTGAAGGRVRVLEDRDQDGTYERSRLFAEGLNFPTGILTWRDGVIVTAAPDIVFLRDTTGDGRADEREVLLSGLSEGNQQLRANGLRWGLDNWVYVAAGGHHGKYALDTKLRSTRAGTDTVIGSRDFRFNPDTGVVEPQSGPTQFGRNRDDWGHWFGTQNSRPLWHYALPDHYLQRNPYYAAPDGQVQVLGEVGAPVYPASALQKRFHDFKASGRFTSACSGMIYRDSLLFPAEEMNGFACEPFHNLVQRIALQPEGVTFHGERAGLPDGPDFFASTDRWCRPVMVRTGPDGGLWVADMYRYMIEHPQWLPDEGKAELLPFYRQGEDKGRIYRVRAEGEALRPIPILADMDNRTLALQLASHNGWVRDKAQQLLLWRDGQDAASSLNHLLSESGPLGQIHALCTLDGLGLLTSEHIVVALSTPNNPGVLENALRLAERHATPQVVSAACKLVDSPDPKVRQQLAFSLGAFPPTPNVADALADLLLQDHGETFIQAAALSSALPHQEALTATLVNRNDSALPAIRQVLAEMALAAGNDASLSTLLVPTLKTAQSTMAQAQVEAAVTLLDLIEQRGRTINDISTDTATHYTALRDTAQRTLTNNERSTAERIAAATVLARLPEEKNLVVEYLATQLDALGSPDELRSCIAALARSEDSRVPGLMIDAWPGLLPQAREQVVDMLLANRGWTVALLDGLENNQIRGTDLSPVRRTHLLNHPDKEIQSRSKTLFTREDNPERAAVIAAYQPALTLTGDPKRGRALYAESCAPCHALDGMGLAIGPDLRTVASHPKEKLLANILDPNLDIQPGYHAYNCELEDGENLFGLIASENATSITMKLPGAKLRTILRSDIYLLESTRISMMPDGWEATMNPQAIADLIAFLKAPQ